MSDISTLLVELAARRVADPVDLLAALRISKATLSRLVASAGVDVLRMGRGRATQYARTRVVRGLTRSLPMFSVSEEGRPTPTATLHSLSSGQHWLERSDQPGELFVGLPPALVDMAPQGYLGRSFPERFPELELPSRIADWSDDHRLIALARRGEDCVGNLILGDESLGRFLSSAPTEVKLQNYPELARLSDVGQGGSSAGGEHPKFGTYRKGKHVLVKFARATDSEVDRRWRDLLWCEWKAIEILREAKLPVPAVSCHDVAGWRFLEVERFDRTGERGRRAVLSLSALADEYLGDRGSWTVAGGRLVLLDRYPLVNKDERIIRWVDTFGQLIGNTDRHFGNLSFLVEGDRDLRMAPIYDMLPMILAPSATGLIERAFTPDPPSATNLDIWPEAAKWAIAYWNEVRVAKGLHATVRRFAEAARSAVQTVADRVG